MNADIEQLRAEVQALTMLVIQQGDAQNGAGGPGGGFFPIGNVAGPGGDARWKDPKEGTYD